MFKNKNSYQYQEAIELQFQSICEPLFSFGIKWFGYIKIFPDGSYLIIAPGYKQFIKQYCLNIKIQGASPTIEIESSPFGTSHYAIFSSNIPLLNKKEDPVLHLLYTFNLWPVFGIYKNRLGFIEVYCFAMNREDNCSSGFYLNNLNILEHFCDYFDEQAKDIIDCSDKQKLGYFEQTFNLPNKEAKSALDYQIEEFLQKTHTQKIGLNAAKKNLLFSLSHRQKECLFLLTRGKTAKQIGQTLRISHRTVETHIVSLKNKMHCTTKDQLIEKVFDAEVFNVSSSK